MRPPLVALAFALAAAFSAWNPLAAPFGLAVGLSALVLAVRARRARRFRPAAHAALAISVLAVLGSAVVLARTAGVGRGLGGADVVSAPAPAQVTRSLDEAASATQDARDRAAAELPPPVGGPPGGEGRARGPSGKR